MEKIDIVHTAVQKIDPKFKGNMTGDAVPAPRPARKDPQQPVADVVAPFFAQWREHAERLAEEAATRDRALGKDLAALRENT
eukprot:10243958-Prorocentrum_lima.AAC.1